VILDQPLNVAMCSIGNNIRYDLLTRNVSINGFFLDFEKPGRFPFTPSSVMEVWLDLSDTETIFFNGKMARVVYPEDPQSAETGPGIGVRIIQIDKENEKILQNFIDRNNPEIQEESDDFAS
jgi:hypothetical protein